MSLVSHPVGFQGWYWSSFTVPSEFLRKVHQPWRSSPPVVTLIYLIDWYCCSTFRPLPPPGLPKSTFRIKSAETLTNLAHRWFSHRPLGLCPHVGLLQWQGLQSLCQYLGQLLPGTVTLKHWQVDILGVVFANPSYHSSLLKDDRHFLWYYSTARYMVPVYMISV